MMMNRKERGTTSVEHELSMKQSSTNKDSDSPSDEKYQT